MKARVSCHACTLSCMCVHCTLYIHEARDQTAATHGALYAGRIFTPLTELYPVDTVRNSPGRTSGRSNVIPRRSTPRHFTPNPPPRFPDVWHIANIAGRPWWRLVRHKTSCSVRLAARKTPFLAAAAAAAAATSVRRRARVVTAVTERDGGRDGRWHGSTAAVTSSHGTQLTIQL